MKKNIILILIVILNLSCSDRKDGAWEDNIKLSQKELQFDSLENSAIIKTGADSWWISAIFFKDGQTFDLSNVDTTANNFTITESEFILERKNGKEIAIKLFENTTGFQRILTVGLQAGNYFDGITITQSTD
ncbi:MAG: hypothetical protein ACJAQX_000462 [Polaribacter sp.]|jgi:hypothetical protein|uniref:hypothetical protein n=1 Tax=Polaribacter sp. TaxID=1920175 RepID=UPI003AD5F296